MAKKMVYVVNGLEKVASLRELAEVLGEKVTKQQVVDGEVDGVFYVTEQEADEMIGEDTTEDSNEDPTEDSTGDEEDDTEESTDVEDDTDITGNIPPEDGVETGDEEGTDMDDNEEDDTNTDTDTDDNEEDTTANTDAKHKVPDTLAEKLARITKPKEDKPKGTVKLDAGTPVDFPEKGSFKDEKELKKFYKKLSDSHLDEWLDLEGLTYKPCDNLGINRMRKCMAIKEYHFPSENKGGSKSKSKYADITTEMLVDMCAENGIQLKDSKGDMRILRMYSIMALREEGFLE